MPTTGWCFAEARICSAKRGDERNDACSTLRNDLEKIGGAELGGV
jgi:hypothetical protein